jgi:hypothetical protein
MKKLLSLVVAGASLAVIPTTAMALPVGTTYDVNLDFGDAGGTVEQDVGTWTIQPSFPADSTMLGTSACRYRASWTNAATLSKTTNLFFDEIQTVGKNDCDLNQSSLFNTTIILAPGAANFGFDPTQQRRPVDFAIFNESTAGTPLTGTIVIAGVPYGLSLD